VNVVIRIGNAVDRAAHRVDKGRIDHVARRAVLMALAPLLISPSYPRLHPGLDVDYGFPEGVIDHPFHRPVAAQAPGRPRPTSEPNSRNRSQPFACPLSEP